MRTVQFKRKEVEIDWILVCLYSIFVIFGWLNIYSVSKPVEGVSWFSLETYYGRQLLFIAVSAFVSLIILAIKTSLLNTLSYWLYGITILLLLLVTFTGETVHGAKSWFMVGGFGVQPSEFAKITTIMALSQYMSHYSFSLDKPLQRIIAIGIILLPMLLTVLQHDTGSALVFTSLIFIFYREGLSIGYLIFGFWAIFFAVLSLLVTKIWVLGVLLFMVLGSYFFLNQRKNLWLHIAGFIFYGVWVIGIDWVVGNVLESHQQSRIQALINPNSDPLGVGWNVTQSKIAIGSGGSLGKGFLNGTQTKFDFVPEQHTDFIFCTIGEEYGWVGTTILILLFFVFLYQIVNIAETAKTKYARIYGYGVASIFLYHYAINIGMTIGLAPVIGIPLPFFSYGGSSMISFSIMLAILLNHYANRVNILESFSY
ncbi:MAG: rod shape-determining protein RodA [Bacteroidia bacterium]|nr:rod shape-determining protein RodA [Bacteroidia bacterium]